MARRRRRDEAPGDETAAADVAPPGPTPPVEEAVESEPQVDVRMRGSANAVAQRLARKRDTDSTPKEKEPDAEKKKFIAALKNPSHVFRVKRTYPPEFEGVQTNVEVYDGECPTSMLEIVEHVTKKSGGGKYKVSVYTTENEFVAADTFPVSGDPILRLNPVSDEERTRIFMGEEEKDAAQINEESLERRSRVAAKLLETERLEAQLAEAREQRQGSKRPQEHDGRIDRLERQLIESRHRDELERVQRESDRKIEEVKALLKSQQPAQGAGQSDTHLLLKQMQTQQDASDRRFSELMKTISDNKMDAMLREIQAIKNKPAAEGGGMLESMKAFAAMAKMFGMNLPGADDDDDDDDDDKPWYEKLVDKALPKILDLFDEKTKKGETVSRDEFMNAVNVAAKQAEDEAVKSALARIQPKAGAPALPPPGGGQVPAAPRPAGPVTELPPPPPAPPAPAPAGAPPEHAPLQIPPRPSLEEELLIRVGACLEMIEREASFMPNEYQWNYEGCWSLLPRPILASVCAAQDVQAMVDALAVNGVFPEKIAELKGKISADASVAAYLKDGLDELKEWWVEKQKNPKFDPGAEEEEEG